MDNQRQIDAFERAVADATLRLCKYVDETPPAAAAPIQECLHIAVSGGRDSVALTHAIARRNDVASSLCLIHIDHGLRADSAADAEFVIDLANKLNARCQVVKVTPNSQSEEAARRARYDAISQAVLNDGGQCVAMAHTSDDQAETVLHRVIRGTGIRGLAGIPEHRQLSTRIHVIRPMLALSRSEVTDYLNAIGQSWRDDPTNETTDFTRNLLRNELLPQIRQQLNPNVNDALLRLAASANDATAIVGQAVDAKLQFCDLASRSTPVSTFVDCSPSLVAEMLRTWWRSAQLPEQGMTRKHWDALVDLVVTNKSNRQLHLPGPIVVTRTRDSLTVET